jgi:hypothetical protein
LVAIDLGTITGRREPFLKTIGLIGGLSWESTAHYYSLLNKLVNRRLGGYEAAELAGGPGLVGLSKQDEGATGPSLLGTGAQING